MALTTGLKCPITIATRFGLEWLYPGLNETSLAASRCYIADCLFKTE